MSICACRDRHAGESRSAGEATVLRAAASGGMPPGPDLIARSRSGYDHAMTEPQPVAIQASIVYLRIAEFSRRAVAEQARLRAQLDAVLALSLTALTPRDRIVLDVADGAMVLVLHDPGAALRLAERVLPAESAGLTLAIGIHHGSVRFEEDSGRFGFSGDGIATAAAVVGFVPRSKVWVSRAFRDALTDEAPGEYAGLRRAGVFTDAALRSHELYSPDRSGGRWRRRLSMAFGVVVIVGVFAGSLAYRALAEQRPRPLAGVTAEIERQLAPGGDLRALLGRLKF